MPEETKDPEIVVPVIEEQLSADAVPVVTGGVRVTKQVHSDNEVVEQQLRTSRADVKRVKTNRVVDGPQQARRVGDTLIIPVVSEVIRVHKEWVVTEEIHITERQALETVQQTVPVAHEEAIVQRIDEAGNVVSDLSAAPELERRQASDASIVNRTAQGTTPARSILSSSDSLLAGKGSATTKRR